MRTHITAKKLPRTSAGCLARPKLSTSESFNAGHRTQIGQILRNSAVQAKLAVNTPGDIYEQEADRVAEQVMRMPEPQFHRPVENDTDKLFQTTLISEPAFPMIQKQPEKEDKDREDTIQMQRTSDHYQAIPSGIEAYLNDMRATGQPLAQSVRGFFEPRFGYNFSKVRVHTDAEATESARALNSRAYTVGHDVVFGKGQYEPDTGAGRLLLAHELAHLVQQNGGTKPSDISRSAATRNPEEEVPGGLERLTREAGAPLIIHRLPRLVQRDFALRPPRPHAVGRTLTAPQMQEAIDFNNRVVGVGGADMIRTIRDVLGVSPDPAVIDEDFVRGVVDWQAVQGVTQDGRLGPTTARRLFREIGAERVGRGVVKSGPRYTPGGPITATVAGGRKSASFRFTAEFEHDPANGIFASCCEVRQFIRWDPAAVASWGGPTVPHGGFPAGTPANTWIEDRDAANTRYGHRAGPFSAPAAWDQYIDSTGRRNQAFGHIYRGRDTPSGPATDAGTWTFLVKVVDVANGGVTIGSQDVLSVNW
ncbi:MAG: DUF4157 domain-containing protein [Thermodesulfobacteriota bacterium]